MFNQIIPAHALKAARIGLVTDVDGTISPIVSQPDAAQVTPRARALLSALQARLTLTAVISGRAAADVRARVGIMPLVYVGNHGMERWSDSGVVQPRDVQQYRPQLEAVRDALQDRLLEGMLLEDKIATLSLHYRNTAQPDAAANHMRPLIESISAQHGLKVHEGRMIFEIRPPLEINKGTAFAALVEDYQLETAFYIGDDVTDVDAMRMARRLRESGTCHAFAIGVESGADTPESVRQTCDVCVSGVPGVEAFLDWLLIALSASSS